MEQAIRPLQFEADLTGNSVRIPDEIADKYSRVKVTVEPILAKPPKPRVTKEHFSAFSFPPGFKFNREEANER